MRLAVPFLVHLMYPIICCEKYKQQFIPSSFQFQASSQTE